MNLLGLTGVKDLLQDKVIETFNYFQEAQMKTWILTGDKVETAIHICQSIGIANRSRAIERMVCTNIDEYRYYTN